MMVKGEGDYLLKTEHYERHRRLAKILAEQGEFDHANWHFCEARVYAAGLEEYRRAYGHPRW